MWPWEHAIVGYLAYSLLSRLGYRERPDAAAAIAVGVGSLLPDLIDKPLSWEFGVFDAGYALGHSIFFALPLATLVGVVARWRGRSRVGTAFALGYLLHLPEDLLYNYAWSGRARLGTVLWPVAPVPSRSHPEGLLRNTRRLFDDYLSSLLVGDISALVLVNLAVAVGGILVWLADGAPVLREFLRGCGRLVRSSPDR